MPFSDNGGEPFFLHVRRCGFQSTAEERHDPDTDTASHRTAALFSREKPDLNPVIAFYIITYLLFYNYFAKKSSDDFVKTLCYTAFSFVYFIDFTLPQRVFLPFSPKFT